MIKVVFWQNNVLQVLKKCNLLAQEVGMFAPAQVTLPNSSLWFISWSMFFITEKKCLQVVFGEISCLRLFEWFWTSIILSVYRVSLKNIDKIGIFVRTMSINIWKKQEMSLGWSITNKYLHIPWSLSCQFHVILEELCLCNISFQNCTL